MISKNQQKGFSLRENCRLRILKDMLSSLRDANPSVPNYSMVVDEYTTKIVSSTLKMMELLEENVLALEKLELDRKPFPNMHTIYFITPTETAIDRICSDFADPDKPTYGNIHIFTTNHLEERLMNKLVKGPRAVAKQTVEKPKKGWFFGCFSSNSKKPDTPKSTGKKPNLLARLITLKELNLDFLCPEETVFHFDMPQALPVVFSKFGLKEERELTDLIADKLSTVVPCLFDYKNIHIVYKKNENNTVAEKVAKRLHQRIEKFLELKKGNEGEEENPSPIKIIILDRSFDPLTPVLHDYYYQAMCYDLLKLKKGIVEYESTDNTGKTTKKKAQLSDADDLWNKYKYKHIAEAMQGVSEDFGTFVATNETSKAHKDMSNLDLKQMSDIVKNMPMYNELMTKYTMHMNLIEQCLKEFTKKGIKEIGEIEQCLATGIDNQGKTISYSKLISMLSSELDAGDIKDEERLRLVLIAVISLELTEKDRRLLASTLSPEDQRMLTKLVWLGINPQKISSSKGKTSKRGENISKKAKDRLKNVSFDLCRHISQMEEVGAEIMGGKLDRTQYGSLYLPDGYDGSLGQKPRVQAGQVKSLRQNPMAKYYDTSEEKTRPKLVFFVIGGISYPEIRVLRELESTHGGIDVIAGGTSIITPMDYVEGINQMISTGEYAELKGKDTL